MAGSIAEVVYKVEWAGKHLERLALVIGGYLQGQERPVPVLNRQGDGRTVLFEIPNLPSPPPEIALVMGDCLYSLRAALDYLVWQLVLANDGTPTERTQFPIYDSQVDRHGTPRRIHVEGGIHPDALATLERLQPYHRAERPEAHPLAILQRLSNIDKHRRLHVTRGATTPVRVVLSRPGHEPFELPAVDPPVLTDSNTLIVGRLEAPGQSFAKDVNVELSGTLYVTLAGSVEPNKAAVLVMEELLQFEREVILPAFTSFLDQSLSSVDPRGRDVP